MIFNNILEALRHAPLVRLNRMVTKDMAGMLAKRLGPGKTVVMVLPNTTERYFSTPLFA